MSARSPELHESALSPPEYRAFSKYYELLLVQDGQSIKSKIGAKIQKSTMKLFACSQLGMPDKAVDEILFRMPANVGKLSQGEVFAVLRLLAHAQAASKSPLRSKQPVDMEMAFVPMEPLPLVAGSSSAPEKATKLKSARPLPPPLPPKPIISAPASSSTSPINAATSKNKPPIPPRSSPSTTPTRHVFPSPLTEATSSKPRAQARMSLGSLPTDKNPFRDIATRGTPADDAEEGLLDISDEEERPQGSKARSWSTSAAPSRKSQPLAPPIPTTKPSLPSPSSSVTNPFRQRLVSDSRSAPSSVVSPSAPPPLPPRRESSVFSSSPAPQIPPRSSHVPATHSSASSIHTTSSRASPVKQGIAASISSQATPSPIMKHSLLAAKDARKSRMSEDGTKVQVIRRSSDASLLGPNGTGGSGRLASGASSTTGTVPPSGSLARSKTWKPALLPNDDAEMLAPTTPSKHNRSQSLDSDSPGGASSAIAQVTEALRQRDLGDVPLPPPRRRQSTRISKHFQQLIRPYLAEDPNMKVWSCASFLTAPSKRVSLGGPKMNAVIILNQPITRKDVFIRVWNACELRYCADGGANRLYDVWGRDEAMRATHLPTMIKGDLDSIRADVRSYYESHGVPIKQDPSEDSTDLMKCMEELEIVEKSTNRTYDLLLAGGLSGRLDQTIHTMSLLHRLRKERDGIMVVSEDTVAWVLDTGKHVIEIDHSTMGQTCGILPVGVAKAFVTTTGLKWNLDWSTSFDGDVSTSNHLVPGEDLVHITTDAPVWWCLEIKPQLDTPPERREAPSVPAPIGLPKPEDIQRSFKELGAGVARVAEGVGKELEWLKGGRGGRQVGRGVRGEKERLVNDSDDDGDDDDSRPAGHGAGYSML